MRTAEQSKRRELASQLGRPGMVDMSYGSVMQGYSCDLETPFGLFDTLFSTANYFSLENKGVVAVFTRENYLGLPKFITSNPIPHSFTTPIPLKADQQLHGVHHGTNCMC